MNLREHAIAGVKRGLVLFPCKPGGTRPIVKFGTDVATTGNELNKWWRTNASKKNIGVRCGWSDALAAHLIVLDIDKQHDGDKSIVTLLQEHGPLPDTYAVATPSGGWHFYFISEKDLRNSASKLGKGIDTRGHNGFVIGEGSIREPQDKERPGGILEHKPGGTYTYCGNTQEIAWLPEWMETLLEDPTAPTYEGAIDHDAPMEVVPAGVRNDRLFREAASLRGKGAGATAIQAYLTERNNNFDDPLPLDEIATIVRSAAGYSVNDDSIYDQLSEQAAQQLAVEAKASDTKTDAPKQVKPFAGIWSQDLYDKEIPPLNYCVEPLLAEGVYLLNGRPKGGKSWLAMEIAGAVATGNKLWEEFNTNKGEVLYLALEDGERRLKERLQHYDNPHNLFLVTDEVERIGDGLEQQIDWWMESKPNTQLIVIDILQRVMGDNKTSDSVYKFDYNMVKTLQEQAARQHVCMLIVHHTRKMTTDHVVDSVSGSQGLAGAADGVWFLQSPSSGKSGKLTMLSRDTDSGEYELARAHKPSGRWEYVGESEEVEAKDDVEVRIIAHLRADGAKTVAELSSELKSSRAYIQEILRKLTDTNEVQRERVGSANSPYIYQITTNDEATSSNGQQRELTA